MSFKRRRSARPDPARRRLGSSLEVLEGRQLLAQTPYLPASGYSVAEFPAAINPGPVPPAIIDHPIGVSLDTVNHYPYTNSGKHVSGQDRQGNRYQIDVTGPGYVVVTDTTPTDGVLDDDINTITIVGADPKLTTVVGRVEQSANTPTATSLLPTQGTVRFNRLESLNGVKSVILNGFILTDTITQTSVNGLSPAETNYNATTGVQLHGGVGLLEFGGIDARFPATLNPVPIAVAIGNPTTPLTVHPTIRIDHIYNTSFNETVFGVGGSGVVPTGPLTTPSVTLFVNGQVAAFNVVSITRAPDLSTLVPEINSGFFSTPTQLIPSNTAALDYQFPIVGTTGRTAVQAKSIDHIRASGGVTNTTFSRSAQPFQNSLTGLGHVGTAQFGGPTDAVAIDSRGNIKALKYAKGIGNPTGLSTNPIYYGTPASQNGYAASGLVGGQVVSEGKIGHVVVGPANTFKVYPQDPTQIKAGLNQYARFAPVPGSALTNAVITASNSIGGVQIVGDQVGSEIKSGYNYYSGVGGVEGVTGPSKIGPVKIRGSMIDSVVAASYRPRNGNYNGGVAGDGTITGKFGGQVFQTTTGTTALGNKGSGFYARFTNARPRPRLVTPRAPNLTGTIPVTPVTPTRPVVTVPPIRRR